MSPHDGRDISDRLKVRDKFSMHSLSNVLVYEWESKVCSYRRDTPKIRSAIDKTEHWPSPCLVRIGALLKSSKLLVYT